MTTPLDPHPRTRRWPAGPQRPLALLAAGVALLLLAACTSAVGQQRQSATQPKDGGILRVGTTADLVPASLFTNSSDTADLLVGQVYESLIDYPLGSLEPKPALATSWHFGAGGRSLTLELRKGVTYHSGRPFTSKDVEFSIKTWADPKWTVQLQRTAAAITGFDTSKPHEITLRFAHPVSNIFDLLDMLPMIDSQTIDQLRAGKEFVGTGPFEFDSWTPGSKLTLSRNDHYWGPKPYLDGIEVSIVPDAQSLVAQLRAGQLDVIQNASNRDTETLGKDDRYRVTEWTGSEQQVYVGANVATKALANVQVRQAIAYALDRNRIVDEVYRGVGVPANLPWPDYSPAYDEKANHTYDYDPAKSKALVTAYEAKHGKLPTIPLTYPAGDGNLQQVAQIVQEDLGKAGIEVQLDPEEQAQVVKLLIGAKFPGLWILTHSYAQYTPSTLAVSAYPFNGEHNASHYVDPGYQHAADAAWNQTPAQAVVKGSYDDLNRQLLKGLFLMEIAILHPQTVSSVGVGGITESKRNEPHFGRAYLGD